MSILDMFRIPAAPAPNGTATPAQPIQNQQTAANGVVPGSPQVTQTAAEPAKEPAPLEKFDKLWETAPVDPNAAPVDTSIFKLDPERIKESTSKMDFGKMLNQETLSKISAGGEEATKAFLSTLNDFGRGMTAQNLHLTTGIVEKALEKQKETFQAQLPDLFKKFQTRDTLAETNPAFSNPALKPVVESLQAQMQLKNPNASSKEINALVTDYMQQMATVFAPKQEGNSGSNANKAIDMDWDKFLS